MSQPTRGLPFGSIYGAMFFVVVGLRSGELLEQPVVPALRYTLALLALALAAGLLGRRGWARWSAVAFAGTVVVLAIRLTDPGALGLIFVPGAAVAGLLLALPATGNARPSSDDRSPADGGGRREISPAGWLIAGAAGLGALGLLVGLSLPQVGADRSDAGAIPAVRSPGRVEWSDFGRGSQRARAEGRPMVVSFETAWCGFCKKLNRTTWKDGEVISRLADVVAVRVDAEEATPRNGFRGRELADRYDVEGYPTLLVLDSQARILARVSGYLGPREFLDWLDGSLGRRSPSARGNMQVSGR